jgi:hypothetical protein
MIAIRDLRIEAFNRYFMTTSLYAPPRRTRIVHKPQPTIDDAIQERTMAENYVSRVATHPWGRMIGRLQQRDDVVSLRLKFQNKTISDNR